MQARRLPASITDRLARRAADRAWAFGDTAGRDTVDGTVQRVVGDLGAVHIEPDNDRHAAPPSTSWDRRTQRPTLVARRMSHPTLGGHARAAPSLIEGAAWRGDSPGRLYWVSSSRTRPSIATRDRLDRRLTSRELAKPSPRPHLLRECRRHGPRRLLACAIAAA
jgi:hypothetical protein